MNELKYCLFDHTINTAHDFRWLLENDINYDDLQFATTQALNWDLLEKE